MGGVVIEEKAINRAQYLDLLYSYSNTLYNLIPDAPLLLNDPSRTSLTTPANGMAVFVTNTKIDSSPVQTSEVNVVHSTSSQQPKGKNKNKGKTNMKMKVKFPCMICTEEIYMKYCPHCEEVSKFMKGTSQPVVLIEPFPTQQQKMFAQNPAPLQGGNTGHSNHGDSSSRVSQVFMCKEIVV
jgi:hypothetical protein